MPISEMNLTTPPKSVASQRSPWLWIPPVYMAEGLPYFAVNALTVILYTQLGIPNDKMAFYTGLLYLPWVIKPFWSPFVDIFSTKRRWTIAMQTAIFLLMACVALLVGTSMFFAATLTVFWLIAFTSATHDIAADGYYMLALDKKGQAMYVGLRSTFYRVASIAGQGGLVVIVGQLQAGGMEVDRSWQICFAILSCVFLIFTLWDSRFMPRPVSDRPLPGVGVSDIARDFFRAFSTFFRKPHIWSALAFMLLFRLPEAFCIKLVAPFLLAPRAEGGLGLTVAQLGLANGTVGVVTLLVGGIVGGVAIARQGLRRWLWPMAMCLALPCVFYCLLAMWQPSDFILITSAIGLEQFGYGFGFTAFMMYLIYFSQGENSTSHYAFCTAFMALGMMLPGMAAGAVWDFLGQFSIFSSSAPQNYVNFFWFVMLCSLATFGACALVHIEPDNTGNKK